MPENPYKSPEAEGAEQPGSVEAIISRMTLISLLTALVAIICDALYEESFGAPPEILWYLQLAGGAAFFGFGLVGVLLSLWRSATH